MTAPHWWQSHPSEGETSSATPLHFLCSTTSILYLPDCENLSVSAVHTVQVRPCLELLRSQGSSALGARFAKHDHLFFPLLSDCCKKAKSRRIRSIPQKQLAGVYPYLGFLTCPTASFPSSRADNPSYLLYVLTFSRPPTSPAVLLASGRTAPASSPFQLIPISRKH